MCSCQQHAADELTKVNQERMHPRPPSESDSRCYGMLTLLPLELSLNGVAFFALVSHCSELGNFPRRRKS